MNFKIGISPSRKKRCISGIQNIPLNKSETMSSTLQLVEEIKLLMKQQCDIALQAQINQLCTYALDLEQKYLVLQKKHENQQQSYDSTPNNTTDRKSMRECSPMRRASIAKRPDIMVGSWKIEPTPRQKFVMRKCSIDVDQIIQKEQQRKIQSDVQDAHLIHSLLDEKVEQIHSSPTLNKISQFLNQSEQDFYQAFQKINFQNFQQNIIETFRFSKEYFIKSFQSIQRLKKACSAFVQIDQGTPLEIFDISQSHIRRLFDCDRVNIYLYEEKFNLFWTKNPENNLKKFYAIKGIAGYIFKTGQLLNILDAYQDVRFDAEFDSKYKQKTKSLLGTPIFNNDQSIMGIIILAQTTSQQFKKEDEHLLSIISKFCNRLFSPLQCADQYITKATTQLQQILNSAIYLFQQQDLKQFIQQSTEILRQNYQIEMVQIYLKDHQQKNLLFAYDCSCDKKTIDKNCGIVGQVYNTNQYMISESCYKDKYFNKIADLETQKPVITLPVKLILEDAVGVIQYVDNKGIDNLKTKIPLKTYHLTVFEQIQSFSIMLAQLYSQFVIKGQNNY